jgi:non-heme chloroperoxidase
MSKLTTKDGTEIYYKDWGAGQPIVFSHGWPLTGDAWEGQMVFLAAHGYRCIAHDRRGHGRSGQPSQGNDMDTYADDLAELIESLDLKGAILVGHSAGGGEVARYIGRHGTRRVAKAVLVGAVAPLMLKTEANPGGLPMAVFDAIRAGVAADRSQFFKDVTRPSMGPTGRAPSLSQGVRDAFWLQGMQGGLKNQLRLRQGLLRDGLHPGPQGVRRPDPVPSRRRRPDRAARRLEPGRGETCPERHPQGVSGRLPWPR